MFFRDVINRPQSSLPKPQSHAPCVSIEEMGLAHSTDSLIRMQFPALKLRNCRQWQERQLADNSVILLIMQMNTTCSVYTSSFPLLLSSHSLYSSSWWSLCNMPNAVFFNTFVIPATYNHSRKRDRGKEEWADEIKRTANSPLQLCISFYEAPFKLERSSTESSL